MTGQTVLVRMELLTEPVITPEGQTMILARLPSMKGEEAGIVIGLEDIALDAILCNCGFARGRNRLTNDAD